MDIEAILKDLRDQREQIEEAILALERLQIGAKRGRGRPPAWVTALRQAQTTAEAPKRRGRPPKAASNSSH